MTQQLKCGDRITITMSGNIKDVTAQGTVMILFDGSDYGFQNSIRGRALERATIVVEKPPLKVGDVVKRGPGWVEQTVVDICDNYVGLRWKNAGGEVRYTERNLPEVETWERL